MSGTFCEPFTRVLVSRGLRSPIEDIGVRVKEGGEALAPFGCRNLTERSHVLLSTIRTCIYATGRVPVVQRFLRVAGSGKLGFFS